MGPKSGGRESRAIQSRDVSLCVPMAWPSGIRTITGSDYKRARAFLITGSVYMRAKYGGCASLITGSVYMLCRPGSGRGLAGHSALDASPASQAHWQSQRPYFARTYTEPVMKTRARVYSCFERRARAFIVGTCYRSKRHSFFERRGALIALVRRPAENEP